MKTVEQFWNELLKLPLLTGFSLKQVIEIRNLVLEGVVPLKEGSVIPETDAGDGHDLVVDGPINTANWPATRESQLYRFGTGSKNEMKGVHPILVAVANRAIQITQQDMVFYDGVRTLKEQAANLRNGTTRTMNSKHLPQKDGYGHAMDLVPYINGSPKWDWDGCYKIACAVDAAATEQGVAHLIRWGGAWDRTLADFGGDPEAYRKEVELYRNRHAGKDFIDGPHFELVGV